MLTAFRNFAKSWAAVILIGLLVISFAVFGINDVFRGQFSDWVVKAGERTVSAADFKRAFDNYRQQLSQQNQGQPVTTEQAVEGGVDRSLLEDMARNEAFSEILRRAGVRPSPELVVAELRKNPGLFDPVTGRFDENIYAQRLAENGLTPAQFEGYLRDELARTHLVAAVVNGLQAPKAYAALGAAYMTEQRDLAWFAIRPIAADRPPAPTDAQLTAFMQENAQRLTIPEMRILTVVRFSAAAQPPQPVDPAEIAKRFEFRKDSLSQAETRTFVQVPAKDAAAAATIRQRLLAGEDPNAVARALGVEAIPYNDRPKSAVADRAVAEAAFALPAGAVSNPIQGGLGLAVVKVTAITPGREATLEQMRPAIQAELQAEAAQDRVYALTEAYDKAHAGGASLTEAAAKAGVPAVTVGPVTNRGLNRQGQPTPGLSPKVLETAFALAADGESEVIEEAKGEYFAVKVDRIQPAALPPLAEVKPQLVPVWTAVETVKRMQARADALVARLEKKEPLAQVAASVGATVNNAVGLDRATAGQNQSVPRPVLGKAFAAKPGEAFSAEGGPFQIVVGQLAAIRPAPARQVASFIEPQRQQLAVDIFRGLGESARVFARTKLKAQVNLERARSAIGVDPAAAPDANAAAPAKK
ncbi:MAG TPA: SurA N-terminal domain-containing protein [Phenylobacterium sp.]|nr:SurA N-terminal domain-containing protein [Phenylobacterium sp.]